MKKNQNQKKYNSIENESNSSFQRILEHFDGTKITFSFDIFQHLKANNEKLLIVYANIRV